MWSAKIHCPVSLGFDVDGVSGAINRDPKTRKLPSLMSMREYGPSVAMPRILDLLDEYEIKASFFVPGFIAETHVELIKNLVSRGHEIGHHGYMHEPPATLNREQEAEVLDRG
ncbi:MAG: polysaccharide deacetylase family protein, partial [Chloroflexota bacterium]|nr:polysaccharide deacetylase family protein [Chloroflexota bacterium]